MKYNDLNKNEDENQSSSIKTDLGQRIKLLRKKFQMTQKDLAERLNVTFQQIQKYEKGRNFPSYITLIKIAELFKVDIRYLYKNMTVNKLNDSTIIPEEDKGVKKMLKMYKSLNQDDRMKIINMMSIMTKTK